MFCYVLSLRVHEKQLYTNEKAGMRDKSYVHFMNSKHISNNINIGKGLKVMTVVATVTMIMCYKIAMRMSVRLSMRMSMRLSMGLWRR